MSVSVPLRFWLWLFDMTMGFSTATFLYEAFVYNMIFVGRILPLHGRGSWALPFLVIFNLVWGLAFWSHLQAHRTEPGRVPQQWQDFVHGLGASIPIAPSRHEFQPGKATLCKRCNRSRPERAHHCQFCRACVLRYDHHCPWIGNCVGVNNHKFFLLTVLYGCAASIIGLLTALPELWECARLTLQKEDEESLLEGLATPSIVAFLVFGLLALVAAVLLGMLISTYVPSAARNLTTVEEGYNNMANPFDLGSARANLEQIFGVLGPDWLIPVRPLRPQTDGVFFPRREERVGPGVLEIRNRFGEEESLMEAALSGGKRSLRQSQQDWSLGDDEDVAAERLWKMRYYVGSARAAALSDEEEGRAAVRRRGFGFSLCCVRPDKSVDLDEELVVPARRRGPSACCIRQAQ